MGDIADETTLRCIQFHLSREVLNGDGDPFEALATGVAHGLEHEAQRSWWLARAAA